MGRNWRHLLLLVLIAAGGRSGDLSAADAPPIGKEAGIMKLTSPAFAAGKLIPIQHTCDGADVSPALSWSDAPPGVKVFALICDDPDAPVGTWVHWVIWGMPGTTAGLPENVAKAESLPEGTRQGVNDFRHVGYGGPCPPPGRLHRYFFKLFALDSALSLKPRPTKQDLLQAMAGHVLAEAQLMGTYQRNR